MLILLRFLFLGKEEKPNDINEGIVKSDRLLERVKCGVRFALTPAVANFNVFATEIQGSRISGPPSKIRRPFRSSARIGTAGPGPPISISETPSGGQGSLDPGRAIFEDSRGLATFQLGNNDE